ncbi:MAG: DMT family transporter [candidate division Zixibacteria bacterium]|nr:DMT family transporter [candidate division Zixibacteria bacterium]
MNEFLGEIAALSTAACWAFTSMFFTLGGRRVGSVIVNRVRLVLALIFLMLTHLILTGQLIPIQAEPSRWFWLGLSGVIGFVIGDAMLFQAFVMIGTRITMLLMSLVPVISTILAWLFLGETLSPIEVLGIAVTIGGVAWVVADKNRGGAIVKGKQLALGVLLGIGGAMGQAVGLLTSKKGLFGDFSALSGNLIRVIIATIVMWILTIAIGKAKSTILSLKDFKASRAILGGSICGPFIGVWLSLVAIQYARIGIASTLMSLTPVLLIPLVWWVFKEKITIHGVLGTLVAIAGVAILLLA